MSDTTNGQVQSEVTREQLEVKACQSKDVSYEGTREQLLEAGVAIPAMFPDPPATRRWSRNNADRKGIVADDFSVTKLRDGRWRVTREIGWDDRAAFLKRKAEKVAARQRESIERDKQRAQEAAKNNPEEAMDEYVRARLPEDFENFGQSKKEKVVHRLAFKWQADRAMERLLPALEAILGGASKKSFTDYIDSAVEEMEKAALLADPTMVIDLRPVQGLFNSTDATSRARCRALQALVNIWACPVVNTDIWVPR